MGGGEEGCSNIDYWAFVSEFIFGPMRTCGLGGEKIFAHDDETQPLFMVGPRCRCPSEIWWWWHMCFIYIIGFFFPLPYTGIYSMYTYTCY